MEIVISLALMRKLETSHARSAFRDVKVDDLRDVGLNYLSSVEQRRR